MLYSPGCSIAQDAPWPRMLHSPRCSMAPAHCKEAFNYCQHPSPTACKLLPLLPKDVPEASQGFGLFSDTEGRTETLGTCHGCWCLCSTARFQLAGRERGERLNPCTKLPKVLLESKKLRVKISSMHSCGHWNQVLTESEPGHPLVL